MNLNGVLLGLNLVVAVFQAVTEYRDDKRRESMGLAEYWRGEAATHMAHVEHLQGQLRQAHADGNELVDMCESLRGTEEVAEHVDALGREVRRLRRMLKRSVRLTEGE